MDLLLPLSDCWPSRKHNWRLLLMQFQEVSWWCDLIRAANASGSTLKALAPNTLVFMVAVLAVILSDQSVHHIFKCGGQLRLLHHSQRRPA